MPLHKISNLKKLVNTLSIKMLIIPYKIVCFRLVKGKIFYQLIIIIMKYVDQNVILNRLSFLYISKGA